MTIAELLRNHADLATREGGMYYSGEYLSRIAKTAESLEAENAKLWELVSGLEYCVQGSLCDCCPLYDPSGTNRRRCESLERELGIEVDE